MQTIGERLEEARKRKGISIREASEATKIRGDYLHKLESNSFELNLPEIYVRGFLRGYASFLKLNTDKILADYKALAPGEGRSSRRESREIYGRMDLAAQAPVAEPADQAAAEPAPTAAPPAPRKSFPASAAAPSVPISSSWLLYGGAVVLAVVLVVGLIFGIRALSGGSSKPVVELKPVAQQTLTLTATGPVDVQVKQDLDGQILWRGHLEAKEAKDIIKRGGLSLTATELANVQIEINGKRVPNPYSGYNKVQIP